MESKWSEICENLKKTLNSGDFKVWIAPLKARIDNGVLSLAAPNGFMAQRLEDRMLPALRKAAAPVLEIAEDSVVVHVHAEPAVEHGSPAAAQPVAQQGVLPMVVAPTAARSCFWRYGFDDFIVGPSNSVAVAAARDVCRRDGDVQTLFVSAPSGLGKTHLSHAVGQNISQNGNGSRIVYLTAEEFVSRFIAALQSNDPEGFKSHLRHADVLLLEDVHFLEGKPKMQETILAVVKSIQGHGGRVVFTSSFSPRELKKVDNQLVSHFCSGILARIDRPNEEMRRDILRHKARSIQVMLPDNVCDFLAERLCGDVRQLESCLNSLVFKARLLNQALDASLALEVLNQYAGVDFIPDMPLLVRLVCESYGLDDRTLRSRSRRREYVLGRNTIYYLARKHTDLSLDEIGRSFNRRHTTVLKGISSIERELSLGSKLGRQIARAVSLVERNAGLGCPASDG